MVLEPNNVTTRVSCHVYLLVGRCDSEGCWYPVCRAFWGFDEHFKDLANQLFSSLDSAQQKQVQSVRQQQPSSSSSQPASKLTSRCRSISTDRGSLTTHRWA